MTGNDTVATVGVTTMVGAPIAVKAQVPLVIFQTDSWMMTIGDFGFIIGALLALTKLVDMIFSSIKK